MSFYLKPPRGDIHLEKLIDLAEKRIRFLHLVATEEDLCAQLTSHPELSDAVMEGTPNDRVSHFVVRLAAGETFDMRQFVARAEARLFAFRLETLDGGAMRRAVLELRRHLKCLAFAETSSEDVNILYSVVDHIIANELMNHCEDDHFHDDTCAFYIPFHLVPDLVSRRRVVLEAGFARITCQHLNELFTCIFHRLCLDRIDCAELEGEDTRLRYAMARIRRFYHSTCRPHPTQRHSLTSSQIATESLHFPPCFRRLHETLDRSGRLPHHDRVAYTLFLKEIGLPLHEATAFWSGHYSKPSLTGECSHSWQKDSKKYLYGLRHLYGCEGARKDYSSHGCSAIQGRGACPFSGEEEASGQCRRTMNIQGKCQLVKPSQFYYQAKEEREQPGG